MAGMLALGVWTDPCLTIYRAGFDIDVAAGAVDTEMHDRIGLKVTAQHGGCVQSCGPCRGKPVEDEPDILLRGKPARQPVDQQGRWIDGRAGKGFETGDENGLQGRSSGRKGLDPETNQW